MSVQTHSNNSAHCLQAGSNPNVSFLSHSCHTITTKLILSSTEHPFFFPTLLPQSSLSTPNNTYSFTLSGSKLHCHLQFSLSHFLPFSKQGSDLGSVICLLEHFFLSPHLSPWLLQPFTVQCLCSSFFSHLPSVPNYFAIYLILPPPVNHITFH